VTAIPTERALLFAPIIPESPKCSPSKCAGLVTYTNNYVSDQSDKACDEDDFGCVVRDQVYYDFYAFGWNEVSFEQCKTACDKTPECGSFRNGTLADGSKFCTFASACTASSDAQECKDSEALKLTAAKCMDMQWYFPETNVEYMPWYVGGLEDFGNLGKCYTKRCHETKFPGPAWMWGGGLQVDVKSITSKYSRFVTFDRTEESAQSLSGLEQYLEKNAPNGAFIMFTLLDQAFEENAHIFNQTCEMLESHRLDVAKPKCVFVNMDDPPTIKDDILSQIQRIPQFAFIEKNTISPSVQSPRRQEFYPGTIAPESLVHFIVNVASGGGASSSLARGT